MILSKKLKILDEYGRFDKLMTYSDLKKAIEYISEKENRKVDRIKAIKAISDALKEFLASGCMEIND